MKDASSIPNEILSAMQAEKEKNLHKNTFTFSESIYDIVDDLREELSHTNFTICNQNLQHWELHLAVWVVYFDPRGDAKTLTKHLVPSVKTIVKLNPVIAFKVGRIFNDTTETTKKKKLLEREE